MPYRLSKQDGKWCILKEDGTSKGCSETRSKAVAHMRALYAAETKDSKELDELMLKSIIDYQDETGEIVPVAEIMAKAEELDEKSYYDEAPMYTGLSTSYQEYEDMLEAWRKSRKVEELIRLFPSLASNAIAYSEDADKGMAVERLAKELADRIREVSTEDVEKSSKKESKLDIAGEIEGLAKRIAHQIKSAVGLEKDGDSDIMFWKDKDSGQTMWVARYSNNFIDEDNPPDIISESSHRRFVENVDKGVYPYPELWLWHQKEWKIGQAVWCAYDDSGFAVAAGYIYPECEQAVKEIASLPTPALSHGMPLSSIVRDENDPRVIKQHQTIEISVLPLWAAANKTGNSFELVEGDAMLPKDKRETLIKRWGLPETTLDALEKLNQEAAAKAAEDGLEQKEADEVGEIVEEETPAQSDTEPEAATENAETADETPDGEVSEEVKELTREEVAEAITAVFSPHIEATVALKTQVDELSALVKELQGKLDKQDDKIEKSGQSLSDLLFRSTPAASIAALGVTGVAGSEAAKVKEGESTTGPAEEKSVDQITGIPFIDAMMSKK